MEELVKLLKALEVGAAGTIAVILAMAVFFFYRRDFLRERSNGIDHRKILIAVVERNASASERLEGTVRQLGELLQHDTHERGRQIEALVNRLDRRD